LELHDRTKIAWQFAFGTTDLDKRRSVLGTERLSEIMVGAESEEPKALEIYMDP
jgi:hypothetical protein